MMMMGKEKDVVEEEINTEEITTSGCSQAEKLEESSSKTEVTCWIVIGERQAARIRSLYLKTILRQDIGFYDMETRTGEVIQRMSGNTVLIQDAMGEKVGKLIQQIATFIGAFVVAFIRGWSLGQTAPCISAIAAGKAAAYKLFQTIERKPEIDSYDPNGVKLDDFRGDRELKDVYFSYPSRPNEQIFNGFSLFTPSGMTAALVGQSGSGKSTVISLIERFYDPQAGEVLIDGIDLKKFQVKWIRQKIGLVS
ncbi:ABC transporter B family protein [Melia azedarach]|uniref:ABC transporter B family protein n=1 Tax=Melia azedarach TaxID=155640 RepID=A0ACC1Y6P0_MELAZ|nr:ABC transporter B family protein [Melia azedarach]